MNRPIKPRDEIVRVDRRPGEITFQIRRENKSLDRVTLVQPIWTRIEEIGFVVREAVVSDPDQENLAAIKSRHPQVPSPGDLRQLRVLDDEGTKISVIFAGEKAPDS